MPGPDDFPAEFFKYFWQKKITFHYTLQAKYNLILIQPNLHNGPWIKLEQTECKDNFISDLPFIHQ